MSKPLLSICIPTYNNANWLRSSLWNWLPQINSESQLVELIVSDNNSSDSTQEVIQEAQAWGSFRYYRNSENVGALKNLYRLVNDLAESQFIWAVGNDDLPLPDALKRVLEVLKTYPELEYVYVNFIRYLVVDNDFNVPLNLDEFDLKNQIYGNPDLSNQYLEKVVDLVEKDSRCFTPIFCSVIRREHAVKAFKIGLEGEIYSSLETYVPQAVYIAKNLLNYPTYYIGHPVLVTSTNTTWKDYLPFYMLSVIPDLYDLLEKYGCPPSKLKKHRLNISRGNSSTIIEFALKKNRDIHLFKPILKHLWRYRMYKTTWKLVFWSLPKEIARNLILALVKH